MLHYKKSVSGFAVWFIFAMDLLHLIENMFDRKRIYANSSSYPNPKVQ